MPGTMSISSRPLTHQEALDKIRALSKTVAATEKYEEALVRLVRARDDRQDLPGYHANLSAAWAHAHSVLKVSAA